MTSKKIKNKLKNVLLNYASHLTVSCEYINPLTILPTTPRTPKNPIFSQIADARPESCGYGQKQIINGLGQLTLVINQLLTYKAKLLVINCTERSQLGPQSSHPFSLRISNNRLLFHMDSGWINGTCSNWSHLCKVAWNSHSVSTASRLQFHRKGLESWVTEAESVYRGLYLQPSHKGRAKPQLAFKRKPDCIFLVNPTPSAIRECKGLHIPLCLLSSSFPFKAANCYLSSNQESYYLIYLIHCIINHYKKLSPDPL